MLKNTLKILFVFSFVICLSFTVAASCEHNFECDGSKSNLISRDNFTHSYYCLKGCGAYGTEQGGVNAAEECSFVLLTEKTPTCNGDGMRMYMCTVCFRNKDEAIPKKNHSYVRTRKNPTCTQNGYDLYSCTECGLSYRKNYKEKISHISDGGIIESMPGINCKGSIKESCRVCGALLSVKVLVNLADESENVYIPEAVVSLKILSFTDTSVSLKWKKSEYALKYKISYSTDKKKWKTVFSDSTSCKVKKLKPGYEYYFKVTAVGDGSVSADSKMISTITRPSRAVIVKAASEKANQAKIKWKKQSNVSGYELSWSRQSFSKSKNISCVRVTKGTEKTLRKLKSGKKYYFRIRSYKKFGSKKVFGVYSKTKTVKIR